MTNDNGLRTNFDFRFSTPFQFPVSKHNQQSKVGNLKSRRPKGLRYKSSMGNQPAIENGQ
jgi:hypothetical protein